jgi:hypothetical protein
VVLEEVVLPAARRLAVASMSGLRKLPAIFGWQWSVFSATKMSYCSARRWAASARTMTPNAASALCRPEANCPAPVENWMIPSDFWSAKAFSAALMVTMLVQLMAGKA